MMNIEYRQNDRHTTRLSFGEQWEMGKQYLEMVKASKILSMQRNNKLWSVQFPYEVIYHFNGAISPIEGKKIWEKCQTIGTNSHVTCDMKRYQMSIFVYFWPIDQMFSKFDFDIVTIFAFRFLFV